ncbi:hypothetical protein JAAARDRAFT_358217 [Jaapia argillacea MUCL 33604]|uniref:Histone deacetylase domain-containing protein n=1 Tax=Jaapia argillacea MUCL 33604 TaxID=933084 RepID=A0A067Q9N5_9AGAM|nr:hypothetical protein JAAARDRAFT_358217 [Jaapia argillacea MUCL 33604]
MQPKTRIKRSRNPFKITMTEASGNWQMGLSLMLVVNRPVNATSPGNNLPKIRWTNVWQNQSRLAAAMKVFSSDACTKHNPPHEILSGRLVPYLESPDRIRKIKQYLYGQETFEFVPVNPDIDVISSALRVHTKEYLKYLETAYEKWTANGGDKTAVLPEALPHFKLCREVHGDVEKLPPIARAGLYCFDLSCPITDDTYDSVIASAGVALSAAEYVVSQSANESQLGVFALTRPPGHHAGSSLCGGYCFLSNVAIAARFIQSISPKIDSSPTRVAILDIDFHHGNGTQEIFYEDPSVLYVSLHADDDYPYFTGSRDERGNLEGEGFNINFPLPSGTGPSEYLSALSLALSEIESHRPVYLIVSLGVDTYCEDPIGTFKLSTTTYGLIGEAIAKVNIPTLFVMEGGYYLESIGQNVGTLLKGFEGHSRVG